MATYELAPRSALQLLFGFATLAEVERRSRDDVPHDGPMSAAVGEVELCYETFGQSRQPAVLLIMGLGFQLIHWPDGFCRALAAEGFHVVRFDNRDAGCSTHLPGHSYTLEDMADDAAGLVDALGVTSAHVVGASLGG